MWQLILLSRVIPAFGALAKEFMEGRVNEDALLNDAFEFYSDIVTLGCAVSISRGEWTSGLSDEDLHPLLKALESRFSKGWWNNVIQSKITVPSGEQSQFPSLFNLASSITLSYEEAFDHCATIADQTDEQRNEYLETMGPKVRLFPQQERQNGSKRSRFLNRVHGAAQHLVELYARSQSELDGRYESLSKHPSHGNWFHNDWDCNSVYLPRPVNSSIRSALTSPYLRTVIQNGYDKTDGQIHHMQCHPQPSILALGIVFLEIITGAKFPKSQEPIPWRRHNEDKRQAEHLLKSLESADRHSHDRKLSMGLRRAVRACLHMEPPPNFPSNNLNKEGPVRHYILSCVVHPLAYELEHGYNIRPEAFETTSVRESIDRSLELGNEGGKMRPVPVSLDPEPVSPRMNGAHGSKKKASRTKEAAMAAEWFDWHNDALLRIEELRSTVPDSKRIKIAILDTGIELTSDEREIYDSHSRIQYKSWIDSDPEWKDEAGHGTHLATLLLRIAPNAIVHVARVFKKQRQCLDSTSRIAEAIEHAAKLWQVDIVIMSFGFPCEIDVIHKAIKSATLNGNILFFAAASNDGNNRPGGVVWPAKDMNVICVHSGNGRGKPSSFTPSAQDGMRVMVLGESVKSTWPQKLQEGDEKVMDSTSCATPIAAGIAALILDYARVFLTPEEWVKLRRVDSTRRLFNNMKDPDAYAKDGYWWIKHWEWFDSKQDQSWIEGQIKQAVL
ncbi:hypothetical protein N7528_007312 [Penicillium herquei]|nr:hypothetical protein N7528_007312 [Penicillium herquei]